MAFGYVRRPLDSETSVLEFLNRRISNCIGGQCGLLTQSNGALGLLNCEATLINGYPIYVLVPKGTLKEKFRPPLALTFESTPPN